MSRTRSDKGIEGWLDESEVLIEDSLSVSSSLSDISRESTSQTSIVIRVHEYLRPKRLYMIELLHSAKVVAEQNSSLTIMSIISLISGRWNARIPSKMITSAPYII